MLDFGLIEKDVQVGINPNHTIPVHERHGTVVVNQSKGAVKLPYTVDYPSRLKRPSQDTIIGMFNQFFRLGLNVQDLEIAVGRKRRVYRLENDKPVLTQFSLI